MCRMTGTVMMEFWLEQYFQSQIIENLGPDLGLHVNLQICELFSKNTSTFPSTIPYSNIPHFEILEAPVGDIEFCNRFFAKKHSAARALLSSLEEIGKY